MDISMDISMDIHIHGNPDNIDAFRMCNILQFTHNSLVLIPYLLNYSPHSLCLSWMKI